MTTKVRSIGARSVDRFLDAVVTGVGVPAELFATNVELDATVPGWRFVTRGAQRVADRYSEAGGWWDRQLGPCLLGAVVQFGWEKALGDDDELGWWCDSARSAMAWL